MKRRINSKWISKKETSFYCIDFSGFETDRQGVIKEIEVSQAVINAQAQNSLLVAVDLHQTKLTPELVAFFRLNSSQARNPIRKMAILGVSAWKRFWYQRVNGVIWPKNCAFFTDYEEAKDWLIGEGI